MRSLILLAAIVASFTAARSQPLPASEYPDGYAGVRTVLVAQGHAPVPGDRYGRSPLGRPCPDPTYCRRLFQGAGGLVVGTAGAVLFGTLFFNTLALEEEGSGGGAAIKPLILMFTGSLGAVSAGGAVYSGAVLVRTLQEGPQHRR